MAQLKKVVEPFGEVNVYPSPGGLRVTATILMEPYREGAQTGIALDGSGSMKKLYGVDAGGGVVSSIFAKTKPRNDVSPVAQTICAYLARTIDADHGTTCVYWATGPNGSQIEVIGDLSAEQAEQYDFRGPRDFGTGTLLLPAVRYFVERFASSPWGFFAFITDGELYDLDEVKAYSTQLAKAVAAGRRNPLKFVLIGLGPDVNERQMEELDDLETGTDIDLWDHKLAAEMTQLAQIFAEVVDKNARVADNGKILDPQGRCVKNYSDTGLPAFMEFTLPTGASHFTLEVNGQRIDQPVSEQRAAPPPPPVVPSQPPMQHRVVSPIVGGSAPPVSPLLPTPPPVLQPAASAPPILQPSPVPPPVAPAAEKKEPEKPKSIMDQEVHDIELDDLTKSLDLEFVDPAEAKGLDLELDQPEEKKDDVSF